MDTITGYNVTYFCTYRSNTISNQTVQVLVADNKTFTASQFIPRTNCTFEVKAFHRNKSTGLLIGPPDNVTGTTEIPEGKYTTLCVLYV